MPAKDQQERGKDWVPQNTWNEVTILWNEVAIWWNEVAWNEVVMKRSDRIPYKSICIIILYLILVEVAKN